MRSAPTLRLIVRTVSSVRTGQAVRHVPGVRTVGSVIDLDGPEPLWRQVADHLAGRIAAKEWARRLPSVRTLADQYDVSHTTVSDALRELSQRGIVTTTRGRGTFIVEQRDTSETDEK